MLYYNPVLVKPEDEAPTEEAFFNAIEELLPLINNDDATPVDNVDLDLFYLAQGTSVWNKLPEILKQMNTEGFACVIGVHNGTYALVQPMIPFEKLKIIMDAIPTFRYNFFLKLSDLTPTEVTVSSQIQKEKEMK